MKKEQTVEEYERQGIEKSMKQDLALSPPQEKPEKEQGWNEIFERFNIEVADKTPTFVTASNLASWLEKNYPNPPKDKGKKPL